MAALLMAATWSGMSDGAVAAPVPPAVVTGPGFGAGPHIRVLDSAGAVAAEWMAPAHGAGARVATGNIDGVGGDEVVVEVGTAIQPRLVAYRPDGSVAADGPVVVVDCAGPRGGFAPCPAQPGRTVAAGDVDGDGRAEVIVGEAAGRGSRVDVYDVEAGRFERVAGFDAFPGFDGGVFVAAGDVDGDGRAEIVTGAGEGGGPHVKVFDLSGATATAKSNGFFGFDAAFRSGVRVATANLDGDGADEIVVGAGPGGGPHVRGFEATGAPTGLSFFAYDPANTAGVYVAGGDADGDLRDEIVTGAGAGGGPHVKVFERDGRDGQASYFAYAAGMNAGVHVAVLQRNSGSSQSGGSGGSNQSGG